MNWPDLIKRVINTVSTAGYQLIRFIWIVIRQFIKNEGIGIASGLAYTTLLGVVPLAVVGFAIFTALPIFSELSESARRLIFNNFIPSSGELVEQYLFQFVGQAAKLPAIGMLSLVVTAFLLMYTVDNAINALWHNNEKRKIGATLILYSLVLIFGPLLIGTSVAVSSYLLSLPLIYDAVDLIGGSFMLLGYLPFLLTVVSLWVMYSVLPKGVVCKKCAFISSVVTALMFESAKQIFVWSMTNFPAYEVIYGALAVIPIFLVWVYLSWLIILVGAQIASCLQYRKEHGSHS